LIIGTFEETRKVRGSDVDFKNRLKLNALFNYMSDAAWMHAEKLQLGYLDLLKAGYFWVLSWAKVELETYPEFGQSVKIRTWPQLLYKHFVIRDFLFSNSATGESLGCGRTAWLLVSRKTKHSVDPSQSGLAFQLGNYKAVMPDLPERIPVEEDATPIYSRRVVISDLDVNQHVNNARYVEFLLDAYIPADFKERQPRSLVLSYLAELRFGADLEVRKSTIRQNPETHYLEGRLGNYAQPVIQGVLQW